MIKIVNRYKEGNGGNFKAREVPDKCKTTHEEKKESNRLGAGTKSNRFSSMDLNYG
jgi:hypothetical protein